MKKILSLTLVFCMLITACLGFSSCSKVSAKKVEKDPQATLTDAFQNTSSSFFTDDAKVGDVLKDALECGAFSISFESETLMGGDVTKIGETTYVDAKNKKMVSDLNVTYKGEELAARMFLDKNGVMLNSKDVFGSDKTVAINLKTLAEKFEDSELAKILSVTNLDKEEMQSLKDAINTLKTEIEKAVEATDEDSKERVEKYLEILKQTVSEEKVENANGKEKKHVVVSYTLTNETLKDLVEAIVKDASLVDAMKDQLDFSLEEAIEEIEDMATINLSVKLYIDAKSNVLTKITLDGTVTVKTFESTFTESTLDDGTVMLKESRKEIEETATLAGEITFSDTEIKLTVKLTGLEEPITAEIKLTKEEEKDSVVYRVAVEGGTGSVTLKLLNASYTYTKSTGAFEIKADIYSDEDDRIEVSVEGNIKVTKDEATLEINKISTEDMTVKFKLVLSAKKISKIPEAPADAKDIVSMTQEDLLELINEIEKSKFGKLIAEFF